MLYNPQALQISFESDLAYWNQYSLKILNILLFYRDFVCMLICAIFLCSSW